MGFIEQTYWVGTVIPRASLERFSWCGQLLRHDRASQQSRQATLSSRRAMSAYTRKADIAQHRSYIRFVPLDDIAGGVIVDERAFKSSFPLLVVNCFGLDRGLR